MKTTIKIHDTQWFKEHCRFTTITDEFRALVPKTWRYERTVDWLQGAIGMSPLEGQVLEVEHDSGNFSGLITEARYKACGYWIPNWAIEWVKEEEE